MQKRWIGVLLAVLLLTVAGLTTAQAQTWAVVGVVTEIDGDLYSYDIAINSATRLTEWGYNEGPIQSPDGRYIAYLSRPEEVVNGSEPYPYAGVPPMNVWVLDRRTGDFTRAGGAENGLKFRGRPAWSPDGTRLVWTELDAEGYQPNARLMIWDRRDDSTRILSDQFDMGFQDGGLWMPTVQWGPGGITRILFTVMMGPQDGDIHLELWNTDNGGLTRFTVGNTTTFDQIVLDHVWVKHNGADTIALATRAGNWLLMNPGTGTIEALPKPPSLRAMIGVVDTYLTPVARLGEGSIQWEWQVYKVLDGGVPPVSDILYRSYGISGEFTPAIGGGGVAWGDKDALFVWQVGQGTHVPISGSDDQFGLYFGGTVGLSTIWETNPAINPPVPTAVPPNPATCSGPAPFIAGAAIMVTDGPPNRLREAPNTDSRVLGQLPAGTQMSVMQSPVCSEGYWWMFVQGTEWQGWTAAGPNNAWLAPVPNVTPNPCPLPPRLSLGDTVIVSPGVPNRLREAPNTSSPVLGQLPAGTVMQISGGPVCSEGINWYEVTGTEWIGWTAEGDNGVYWLNPLG
jgi:hypothetical protein